MHDAVIENYAANGRPINTYGPVVARKHLQLAPADPVDVYCQSLDDDEGGAQPEEPLHPRKAWLLLDEASDLPMGLDSND